VKSPVHSKTSSSLFVISVLFVLLPLLAWGQANRGTITGTVTDPSGAAVPDVQIVAKNTATNVETRTVSTATGSYRLVGIPVGTYTLTATAPGFQSYVSENVLVQLNQTTVVDIPLKVGAVTESVTVSGGAVPLISTESSDIGMVVEYRRFRDLPLTLGGGIRNPSTFIKLSPGVNPQSTWRKSISGGGAFQDQVYYDGMALSRGDLSNDAEVNPSVDAIAEFKLISNNYSAEYSHALGGVTSFTMKSGTNELHGSAFEFLRNEKLDASGFFNPTRSPAKQNEWGGTIGGPVILPKIYNGKDRTFWFFSFDQFYRRGGQLAGLNTIPTARMQEGDFSELPRVIYDPATTRTLPDGTVVRDPFPNAIIPENRWSSVTSVMLPYHPKPDFPGVTANSVAPLASPKTDQRTMGFKIDHSINDNNRFSAMFNYTDRPAVKSPGPSRLIPVPPDATALMNYNVQRVTTRVFRFNLNDTLSPTTLNHLGLGYSRFRNPNYSKGFNQGWTQPDGGKLGLRGLWYDLFPTVLFDTGGYTRYGDSIASEYGDDTYTLMETVTMIRGNHTLKVGTEVLYHRDNTRSAGNGGGTYHFRRNETGLPANFGGTGDAWASFLLGEVHSASAAFRALQPTARYWNIGFFINDTWKITAKLTLNLGFRSEIVRPHSDPAGRFSYVDLSKPNPEAGNWPGAMVFGGKDGFGNQLLDTLWWNPSPRFGFAYRLTNSAVIRGGVGIFNSDYINQGLGKPAFGFSTTASFASADNGITPAFNWDDGFPQNFEHPPIKGPSIANGQSVTVVFPSDYHLPYKVQWNLTLEKQFGEDLSLSASYVANKGTHLYESTVLSQIPDPATALPLDVLRAPVNSELARQYGIVEPFPGFSALWGSKATVAQALRPYPQFNTVSIYGPSYGNSSYNSFQFKLDKRYKFGLSGTLAYTWSKFLTDASQFDSFAGRQSAYKREKSYSVNDIPQILSLSYMYELPFGRGKHFLSGISGGLDKLVGGWKVAAVQIYSSGTRLGVTTNNTLPYFNRGLRPDLISSDVRSNVSMSDFDPARDQYLNKSALQNPTPGHYGSAPRYLETRGPKRLEEPFAVLKDTKLHERYTLQFRMEIQNPLNRVVFRNPVTNFASGNFGRITGTQIGPRNIQFGLRLMF